MKNNRLLLVSVILNVVLLIYVGRIIYKKGGIDYIKWKLKLGEKPVQSYINDHYQIKRNIHEIMPKTANDIIFLGDSMTEYCNWNELLDNPNIKNRGISGDVIKGVSGRIDNIVDANPKQLFLMMGINDLQEYESVHKVILDYEDLIKQIKKKSPQTELILQSILPTDDREKAKNRDIIEINVGIKNLAEKHNLSFINLYDSFKNDENKLNPDLTVDGVHLNGAGYLVWKNVIQKYISQN